ncbi:hypothetical protein FACS1894206_03060 [Deltaproteobacteria bacterium]|nr:hypothetical protein FACS1894206_03060 [Deltaproteobacteria bacterium]
MRILTRLLAFMVLFALSGYALVGCALFQDEPREVALVKQNPVSLHNFRIAREYAASGRLELAREHYLLAYAAAEDDALLQDMLRNELKTVDLQIRALR